MKVCKIPCNDCPFRKNSLPGWLADYTPIQLHQLVMSEQLFPCHLSHEENITFNEVSELDLPLCKGALMYMKKAAKMPRNKELNEIIKNIDRNDLDSILSVLEFIDHHSKK